MFKSFFFFFFFSSFSFEEVKLLIDIYGWRRKFVLYPTLLPCKALQLGSLSLDKAYIYIWCAGKCNVQGTWFTYKYADPISKEWRRNTNTERDQNMITRCDEAFSLLFLFPNKNVSLVTSHGDFFFGGRKLGRLRRIAMWERN